jgi:glutamyl-tRNA synthetase
MLAVVVDDHDMGVTHIIRGNDHFTNAARQIQIYNACGWDVPIMSHIPLIHGADGAKLSKRHGALGVEAYREMGYLPAALRNYLVRLGWSHGDQEFFTDEEMAALFALENVGRSPSRFDFAKLENMNGQYIRQSENKALMAQVMAFLPFHPHGEALQKALTPQVQAQMLAVMGGLKDRAKTLVELIDSAHFLYAARPLPFEDKAKALLNEEAKALLLAVQARFAALEEWSALTTDGVVRELAQEKGVKLGAIAQPLRAAMTGRTTSPGIFDVLAVLGQDETLARIKDAIA